MQPPNDPLLVACVLSIGVTSFAAWGLLLLRWQLRSRLLSYEPRRPVPWGVGGALLASLWVLNSIAMLASENPQARPVEAESQLSTPQAAQDESVAGRPDAPDTSEAKDTQPTGHQGTISPAGILVMIAFTL